MNRKIYAAEPNITCKINISHLNGQYPIHFAGNGILHAPTAVSAFVYTFASKSCVKFVFMSLHLELLASQNLVYTFQGPPGRVVYGFQLAQAIFYSPWASWRCLKLIPAHYGNRFCINAQHLHVSSGRVC